MTSYTDSPLTRQHSHSFDQGNPRKNAKLAMLLTLAMMVLEITAGYYFNSMALLADGWHMSSHAGGVCPSAPMPLRASWPMTDVSASAPGR
jgi:Co/Zn/Cd efflux system component